MLAKDKKPKPPMTYRHRGRLCNCEAQITDLLARLEKLEREALTKEKLLEGSVVAHIALGLRKYGFTEGLEAGSYDGAGVVPPELEAIGRENSAALAEMMKKIDG